MRIAAQVLCLILASVFASGCKSKPSLAGHWSGTMSASNASVDMDADFQPDGSLTLNQSASPLGITTSVSGTYTSTQNSIEVVVKSIDSPSMPRQSVDQSNAALAKNPQKVTFTLNWKDGDTIELQQIGASPPFNVPFTLRRKR